MGRPNVGKSTLFNCLTRTRDALVADYPGLTRDRKFGRCRLGDREFLIVDTGGIGAPGAASLQQAILRQVEIALEDADLVLFVVDAREGVTALDEEIADRVRRLSKPVILVVNKTDGLNRELAFAEFCALGLKEMVGISAAHSRGIASLLERIDAFLVESDHEPTLSEVQDDSIKIAVVGRPNVGKSTLINRLLGEERVIVADLPGTTRDVIAIPFERDGRRYTLFDTAGIRRRSRIHEAVEKFSVIKALKAAESAQAVIFLVDATEGVTDQDCRLIGQMLEAGKAMVIGINKWDGLTSEQKHKVKNQLETKLSFCDFVERVSISALHGTGVGELFDRLKAACDCAQREFSTACLCKILEQAVKRNPPPLMNRRRSNLKFAHQGGKNPLRIVIHGSHVDAIPASYERFLTRHFLQSLGLRGAPVRLEFRSR